MRTLWIGLAALALVGCKDNQEGCSTDQDCKADRICDAKLRLCVDPAERPGRPDAGAGDAGDAAGQDCTPGGTVYKHATNELKLPGSMASYALDIDGDGRQDNQLKAILSAVSAAGLSLDTGLNDAIANGESVTLTAVQAADLTTGCAQVIVNRANKPPMKPRFDGSDVFTAAGSPATLAGTIAGGKLSTIPPRDQKGDQVQKVTILLPLGMGGNLPLVVYGAHISGTVSADRIINGEIHGAILAKDIDEQIIPAIAMLLTDLIHKGGSSVDQIVKLFEDKVNNPASKAKCMVAADCCELPANRMTCKITAEEVKTNSLISSVLAPDLQVMQNGVWSPVPKGAAKDAMSVGLGFGSVKASW